MQPARVYSASLAPHPDTRNTPVHHIDAHACRKRDGTLELRYTLHGDLTRLRVPLRGAADTADPLWQHTCFEAFVRREEASAYHELNFSPSGAWAAYAFERYRERMLPGECALEPHVTLRQSAELLELAAVIRLDLISPLYANARLALAMCAVIEESDGALSYWALRHPSGTPDFHHRDGYALEL